MRAYCRWRFFIIYNGCVLYPRRRTLSISSAHTESACAFETNTLTVRVSVPFLAASLMYLYEMWNSLLDMSMVVYIFMTALLLLLLLLWLMRRRDVYGG